MKLNLDKTRCKPHTTPHTKDIAALCTIHSTSQCTNDPSINSPLAWPANHPSVMASNHVTKGVSTDWRLTAEQQPMNIPILFFYWPSINRPAPALMWPLANHVTHYGCFNQWLYRIRYNETLSADPVMCLNPWKVMGGCCCTAGLENYKLGERASTSQLVNWVWLCNHGSSVL